MSRAAWAFGLASLAIATSARLAHALGPIDVEIATLSDARTMPTRRKWPRRIAFRFAVPYVLLYCCDTIVALVPVLPHLPKAAAANRLLDPDRAILRLAHHFARLLVLRRPARPARLRVELPSWVERARPCREHRARAPGRCAPHRPRGYKLELVADRTTLAFTPMRGGDPHWRGSHVT